MFYILEKIIKDDPNKFYASCWNQQIIRPCYDSKERYRGLIEGTERGTITFEGCVCHQEENETEEEFILRASLHGYVPDFICYKTRDFDWKERTVKVKDEEQNCEYIFDDDHNEVRKIFIKDKTCETA